MGLHKPVAKSLARSLENKTFYLEGLGTMCSIATHAKRSTRVSLCTQDIDGAWAGGRGFKKQPYLTVVDAGGGRVTGDVTTMVTASVTPSLMVSAKC